ncbi:MAG: helix-turn-helix domain-containing protein [Anaerolineaceae bacterium]
MVRHALAPSELKSETRDRILAVACALFARRGYQGTTIRLIAKGAGVTDPAVYYYFPTKRALHDALLVEPLIDTPLTSTSDLESAIATMVTFFTGYAASADLVRLSFREQISSTPAGVQFRRDNDATYRKLVRPFFVNYYGDEASQREDLVTFLLCGLFWDAILRYGDSFESHVRGDGFQQNLLELLRSVLPVREGHNE